MCAHADVGAHGHGACMESEDKLGCLRWTGSLRLAVVRLLTVSSPSAPPAAWSSAAAALARALGQQALTPLICIF